MKKTETEEKNSISTPKKLTCSRCKHIWFSNLGRRPAVCPRCKSYDWDKFYKQKPQGMKGT